MHIIFHLTLLMDEIRTLHSWWLSDVTLNFAVYDVFQHVRCEAKYEQITNIVFHFI